MEYAQLINPSGVLEATKACGVLTYVLMFASLALVAGIIYMYLAKEKAMIVKDKMVSDLNGRIVAVVESEANSSIQNIEIFAKLTEALDKILVDDRENAKDIKNMIEAMKIAQQGIKEVFIMKVEYLEDLIKLNNVQK